MPPIPVHSHSPISPTSGIAAVGMPSSTASDENSSSGQRDSQGPAAVPATTTGLAQPSTRTAQPGASAGPLPTSLASPTPSRYMPTPTVPPSATQTLNSPHPPQPGAVPSPFQSPSLQLDTRNRPSVPPPPKAGEMPKPTSHYALQYESSPTTIPSYPSSPPPPSLPYHQQQPNISTPIRAQPPASLTSTPLDLSHPPGYVQDHRASFEERPPEPYQPFANRTNHRRTPSRSHVGILDESPEDRPRMEEEDKGIWGEAVSWAKKFGGKVVEGEEAIWRKINGGN